jgi:hypothetical protein
LTRAGDNAALLIVPDGHRTEGIASLTWIPKGKRYSVALIIPLTRILGKRKQVKKSQPKKKD